MSDTPDGGYTLDLIGAMVASMQAGMREMNDRLTRVETNLTEFKADMAEFREETSLRFRDIEAALFRQDVRWRETEGKVDGLRTETRGLRTACDDILRILKADAEPDPAH